MKLTHCIAALFVLLATSAFAGTPRPDLDSTPITAIIDIAVIPMTSEKVLQHQTVLTSGETILALGPVDQVKVPLGAFRISGAGLYLMPGLVDSHVHLETVLGARSEFGDAPLFLQAGITTVLNLRGDPEHLHWRQLIRSGQLLAPNLYTAGDFINEPRINTTEEAEQEVLRQIHDGYDLLKIHEVFSPDFRPLTTVGLSRPTYNRLMSTARNNHIPVVGHLPAQLGLLPALEEHQNLAHIVMYTLGYFLPFQTRAFHLWMITGLTGLAGLMLLNIIGAGAAVVRRWKVRLAPASREDRKLRTTTLWLTILAFLGAATYGSCEWLGRTPLIFILTGCALAIAMLTLLLVLETVKIVRSSTRLRNLIFVLWSFAGLAYTSSLFYFVPISWRSTSFNVKAIARRSADAKIAVMTTLVVDHVHEMAHDPRLGQVSKMAREYWGVADGSIGSESWLQRLLVPHFRRFQQQIVKELHDEGVPLLAGTDTFGFPGVAPGLSLHKELELLQESGLTPYEVLRTATVNPAVFLNQADKFGQVAPQQRADLVLVDGNPLESLKVLGKVRGIFLRGKWLDEVELQKRSAALKD